MRMSIADASEAARELAAARWGDQVLRRSATEVLDRAGDRLSARAAAELRTLAASSTAIALDCADDGRLDACALA